MRQAHDSNERAPAGLDFEHLLAAADIRIGGDRPWDPQVHRQRLYSRVLAQGSLGLGEAYMDGDWDCQRLDEFFYRILHHGLDAEIHPVRLALHALRARVINLQTARRAWQVGRSHYDLGNEFYAAMLDPRLTYTCGYWREADSLAAAQEAKLDLICRKLALKPGQRVLDIGCGWGSFMGFAAERYGIECVGVTVSREQARLGAERYRGLPVEFRVADYRELDERFDHIVSVGMFEHVGHKNHRNYLECARRCLAPDGLFLLHTIAKAYTQTGTDPWIDRYIFPNGEIPSLAQIAGAAERLFVVEDVHNFGADYDRTLLAWHANVEHAWPRFAERYGERFRRMWRYYLLCCAGAFRARKLQLLQLVLSPHGVAGGYRRV